MTTQAPDRSLASECCSTMLNVGKLRMHVRHASPPKPARGMALVLHGYGEHARRYDALLQMLAGLGLLAIAPDLRGHGESSGRRGYVRRWPEYLDDLRNLLEVAIPQSPLALPAVGSTPLAGTAPALDVGALEDDASARAGSPTAGVAPPPAAMPALVFGHSHGGLVAIHAAIAGVFPPTTVLALSSPYIGPAHVVRPWRRSIARVLSVAWPWVRVGSGLNVEQMTRDPAMQTDAREDPLVNRSATPRWYVSVQTAQRRAFSLASELTNPLLLMTAGLDSVACSGTAERWFASVASPDKTLVTFADCRHELLRDLPRHEVLQTLSAWAVPRVRSLLQTGPVQPALK